jgi:hypothetical protein
MTLCLAWRRKGYSYMAADSRITFRKDIGDIRIDTGIKVMAVPARVHGPTEEETGSRDIKYDHVLGMCFAGSSISGYMVTEAIHELLLSLQIKPTDLVSMDDLCKVIRYAYEHVSRNVIGALHEMGRAGLIVGGYCQKEEKIRFFEFSISTEWDAVFNECLHEDGRIMVGTGKPAAELIFSNDISRDELLVLSDVIDDEAVETVGGHIQFGEFVKTNFQVRGVRECFAEGDQFTDRLHLHGLDIETPTLAREFGSLMISKWCIDPFDCGQQGTDHLNDLIRKSDS